MKKILLVMFLICAPLYAQHKPAYQINYGGALPLYCNPLTGDVFVINAGAAQGCYLCVAANTWEAVGSIGGAADRFYAGDGTAALPSFSFDADTSTGFFRGGAGRIDFSSAGATTLQLSSQINFSSATNNQVLFTLNDQPNILRLRRSLTGPSFFRMHNSADTGTADADGFSIGLDATPDVTIMNHENADLWFGVNNAVEWSVQADKTLKSEGVTFANLPAAADGSMIYCSDCTIASPCAGAGTGAFAKRLNGAWECN